MTLKKWCEQYFKDESLTVSEKQEWVDRTGMNPEDPSSSNTNPSVSPGSSSPTVTKHLNANATALQDTAYECGNPGGKISRRTGNYTLPVCSWNWDDFAQAVTNDTVSYKLRFVTNGGVNCDSISDCTGPEVCGLSQANLDDKSTQTTCGTLKGYWTADQICGVNPSFGKPFFCSILYNLYGCVGGTQSCYSASATSNCCGCANWWTALSMTPPLNVAPYNVTPSFPYPLGTEYCVSQNTNWVSSILPYLKPIKALCPTAYTFPFDDKSSTFTCNNGVGSTKPLDFWITFCPDTTAPTGHISNVSNNNFVTIRFVNKCSYDVWPALSGGSAANKATIAASSGQVTNCNTDADCIDGTKCVATGTINQCFWLNPYPYGGSVSSDYKLAGNTGTPVTMDFHLPIGSNTGTGGLTPIIWSGIMTGRLNCASFPCATSDCEGSSSSQGCEASKGFIQPGGQAEFTMQTTSTFYDIELINGQIVGKNINGDFGIEIWPDSLIV